MALYRAIREYQPYKSAEGPWTVTGQSAAKRYVQEFAIDRILEPCSPRREKKFIHRWRIVDTYARRISCNIIRHEVGLFTQLLRSDGNYLRRGDLSRASARVTSAGAALAFVNLQEKRARAEKGGERNLEGSQGGNAKRLQDEIGSRSAGSLMAIVRRTIGLKVS